MAQRLGRRAACRPALDAEHGHLLRAERAPERVSERADRRVILEHEHGAMGLDHLGEPGRVDRVEPRQVHDSEPEAAVGEELRRDERLVQHHRPVREQDGVRALPHDASAPRLELAVELDATRRRPDGEPDRDVPLRLLDRPAHHGSRLLRVRRLHDRHVRKRAEQGDVADALVRLPRPGRDQPGVVERVDDLRLLARLVVDLLVRSRREERRERVDDREQPVARHARRRGDHVLLGDAALDEPIGVGELEGANAAVGSEVCVEDDEALVALRRARRAPPRTPRRRTRR